MLYEWCTKYMFYTRRRGGQIDKESFDQSSLIIIASDVQYITFLALMSTIHNLSLLHCQRCMSRFASLPAVDATSRRFDYASVQPGNHCCLVRRPTAAHADAPLSVISRCYYRQSRYHLLTISLWMLRGTSAFHAYYYTDVDAKLCSLGLWSGLLVCCRSPFSTYPTAIRNQVSIAIG